MKLIPVGHLFAKVDDEDFDRLNQYKWQILKGNNTFYGRRTIRIKGSKKTVLMHREILEITDPKIKVDHIKHDGLDNRKSKLRIATQLQNMANRTGFGLSKYLGVSWKKRNNKWQVGIKSGNKIEYLGLFINEIDAAKAYNEGAKRLHGKYANLNKI